jgi:hypothetical protein
MRPYVMTVSNRDVFALAFDVTGAHCTCRMRHEIAFLNRNRNAPTVR